MNGLQSLMQGAPRQPQQPQRAQPQQQAQQMDPRMNAAMSVVQEDVPESLRDLVSKNDFAQKAMELLQSAGGQAAMNQPAPQPPTVAQRTDQRAAEGVAGLMQRLAPGMQQRGQQVQRAQARQMLGGGLPMQAAPNMQRMANGGIVGYAEGGMPQVGAQSKGPIPQMSPEENAQMLKYLEGLKKFDYYDKNPDKISPEGRQALELERRMFEEQFPNAFKQKVNDMMYGPSEGMAMGGRVKGYAGPDGSVVEADEEFSYAEMVPTERQESTMPSLTSFFDSEREFRRKREEIARLAKARNISPEEAARVVSQSERPSRRLDEVPNLGGIGSLTSDRRTPDFRMRGVSDGRPTATEFMPEGSSVMGGAGQPTTSETVLNEIMGLQMPEIDLEATPKSSLRQPVIDAAMSRIGVDSEAAKRAEEDRVRGLAEAAYAMSPEMRAAYAQRGTALDDYYAAMLDPERQRKAERRAVLSGLATPGGIARSGIAAGANLAEVRDMPIEARRKQAEEMFGLTKEQEDVGREARTKGFEAGSAAGQSVYERSMAATNQAMQSLSQLATSEETAGRELAFKEFDRSMKALGNQLNFYLQKEKLNADERVTAQRVISDTRRAISATNNTIAKVQADAIMDSTPEQKAQTAAIIQGLRDSQLEQQGQIDQLLPKVGVTPGQRPSSGGGSTALPAGFVPDQ